MEILKYPKLESGSDRTLEKQLAEIEEHKSRMDELRSEIKPLKLGIQIPYPRLEVSVMKKVVGQSGAQAMLKIDEEAGMSGLIDYEAVLSRGKVKEEVGRGVRMQYLNLLAASVPPQPHYLTLTDSCRKKMTI